MKEDTMKDSNQPSPSSSSSSSFFFNCCESYLLLCVLVPLVLLSLFVCLVAPSGLAFLKYPPPWRMNTTKLPSPSFDVVGTITSSNTSIGRGNQKHVDLINTRVGNPQKEEALSDASSFNLSSPPTLPKSSVEASPPNENEGLLGLDNGSDINPKTKLSRKHYSKLEILEASLGRARVAIKEAGKNGTEIADPDYIPHGPMYHNSYAFQRSYLEMEKQFKVFVYEEGEPPLFHNGPCKSIYSSEGNFIYLLEVDQRMRTRDPEEAHVFFLPFSIAMMVHYVYVKDSHDIGPIKQTVVDYVNTVSTKYPYWNRSLGADHFMLSCHDWGPVTSSYIPYLFKNSIRALCNANTSEGFRPSKDVSFPEINLVTGDIKGWIGGPSPSQRPILAFFAGGLHGPIRPILLEHWKGKDDDIQVYERLPRKMKYHELMKKSRFCICPSGYEVASPRIVEAIYTGCVPVLISDHYVPPFSDVLNWKSFSVEVPVSKIPELKNILNSISQRQYIRMQRRVLQIRRHFEVNSPPKRFDVYHMILHSIWLRRLNVHIHDVV